MQTTTVLLIVIAALVSFALAWYQYIFKKKRSRLHLGLSALRFGFLFCLCLLLIGPEFKKFTTYEEKSNLVIAVDNSSSLKTVYGEADATKMLSELLGNKALQDKFVLRPYTFASSLKASDSLDFSEAKTDISAGLDAINEIYRGTNTAVILVTDGNQTLGRDYEYIRLDEKLRVYPMVVGDTTRYEDIRIAKVNANKYAFLDNQFPIEIAVSYAGGKSIRSNLTVSMDGQQVAKETIVLSANENSALLTPLLKANRVGLKNIKVSLKPIPGEKNTANNSRTIALEVIDEKTNISIVSAIKHPDIGMLKKSIENNEQRSVSIITPNAPAKILEETDVFLLYQPSRTFQNIYDFIQRKGVSTFTVTGSKTDWNFMNKAQSLVIKEDLGQTEELFATQNEGFSFFDTSDFNVAGYPPVLGNLGDLIITKPFETLLYQKIKGIPLKDPLLAVVEDAGTKAAFLFGENSWKWRVETYRNQKNFKNFDDTMDKLIRFLSDAQPKSRLDITYESIYEGAGNATVNASYFDKAYVFDPNAKLVLRLDNAVDNFKREIPMLLSGTSYKADLSDLQAGDYVFTVVVEGENISKSGRFKILDFDLEQQLLSSNYAKLERLAIAQKGRIFYPSQKEILVETLLKDSRFIPIQKSTQNVVSLIDFRWLLGLTVLFAAVEWFIRKYNGLI